MQLMAGSETGKTTAWSNLIGMLLVATGILDPLHLDDVMQQLSVLIGALLTAFMSAVYIWGKVHVKGKELEAETKKSLG